MKSRFPLALTLLAAGLAGALPLAAKDPRKPAATPVPTPSPAPAGIDADPLARWLLQQDGQHDAIPLPLGQLIHAATGKNILPFDPKNAADAAFLAKLGAVMDRVLPRMNKPDSPAHTTARPGATDEIAARFEDEIRAGVRDVPGLLTGDQPAVTSHAYPALRLTDSATGKTYYLAVTLYPAGKRGEHGRAMVFSPGDGGRQIPADGCCLLVGIEHNGKPGAEMAFLNWDVTDVSALPVRVAVTFEGDAGDVYHPGAVLTDGRKGSD